MDVVYCTLIMRVVEAEGASQEYGTPYDHFMQLPLPSTSTQFDLQCSRSNGTCRNHTLKDFQSAQRTRKCHVWRTTRSKEGQKHTAGWIHVWSPTTLLTTRTAAYEWQSGRDAQYSEVFGRMYKETDQSRIYIHSLF